MEAALSNIPKFDLGLPDIKSSTVKAPTTNCNSNLNTLANTDKIDPLISVAAPVIGGPSATHNPIRRVPSF